VETSTSLFFQQSFAGLRYRSLVISFPTLLGCNLCPPEFVSLLASQRQTLTTRSFPGSLLSRPSAVP